MTDDSPAQPHRPYAPVIRTQADIEAAWRQLIRPLGFHRTSLWLMLIRADGIPLPQLIEIDDCAGPPVSAQVEQLATLLGRLLQDELDRAEADTDGGGRAQPTPGPGARWALLRSRPGEPHPRHEDRAWAAALAAACGAAGIRLGPMHVATDHDIRPVPLDALDSGVCRSP